MAFGLDFSKSKSKSSQDIWGPQATQLKNLYSSAGSFFGAPNQYLQSALSSGEQAIPGLSQAGQAAIPQWQNLLSGGTFGGVPLDVSAVNQYATGAAAPFQTYQDLMNAGPNPYLSQMAGAGLYDLGRTFREDIMPSIQNQAEFSGGLGGSRQGIAEGLAAERTARAAGDYLANLYGGQYQSDMNRRLLAAQGYSADQLAGIEAASGIGRGADLTGLQALAQGPTAMNLGFAGPNLYNQLYGMQWSPYTQFADILGGPQVLGTTESSSVGYGMQFPTSR